jgi:hypothetical protein
MKRFAALWIALIVAFANQPAKSAEGAVGFYLLGSKGSMAGVVPPPGAYAQSIKFFYSGNTSANLNVSGLTIAGQVEADAFYELPVGLWVAPGKVLGGNFALSLITPIGWKDVSAGLSIAGPGGTTLASGLQSDDVAFGDPVPGALLGWHAGNWHWNVGMMVNVPIGFWKRGNLSNIGFNRTAIDTNAAVTWLDPNLGLEVSTAVGFTYNFKNPDTEYKTGTELHAEWAAIKSLSKTFGIGLVGYHYQQISGDSGSGASLGDFKGRVTALGPAINYSFSLGNVPISTNWRYLKEFNVKNRLEGQSALLTVTIPLGAN